MILAIADAVYDNVAASVGSTMNQVGDAVVGLSQVGGAAYLLANPAVAATPYGLGAAVAIVVLGAVWQYLAE